LIEKKDKDSFLTTQLERLTAENEIIDHDKVVAEKAIDKLKA